MILDEAIKHCEEVAEKNENDAQIWHRQTKGRLVDFCDKAIQAENKCTKCAEEHRQLAEWLKDYKRLLEQEPKTNVLDKIRAEIVDKSYLSYDDNPRHIIDESWVLEIIDKYKESEGE